MTDDRIGLGLNARGQNGKDKTVEDEVPIYQDFNIPVYNIQ